jgi:hypothetical protein
MFGPNRSEMTKGWRRLHNEKFYDLYFSTNTTPVIKSGKLRSAGERRGAYGVLVGRIDKRRPLGTPSVDGSIILKWIFKT